jgi:hypothetical protein
MYANANFYGLKKTTLILFVNHRVTRTSKVRISVTKSEVSSNVSFLLLNKRTIFNLIQAGSTT